MAPIARKEYKPVRHSFFRYACLGLCILAAVMQFTLSPSSRLFLASAVASSRAASMTIKKSPERTGDSMSGGYKKNAPSAEGSSFLGSKMSDLTDFFTSFTAGGGSGGEELKRNSGGGGAAVRISTAGVACKGGSTGPPLDYKAAVKRYLSLPWSMRREGASHTGGSLLPAQTYTNFTCFKSPYAIGGPLDGPCKMEDHIFYPMAPKDVVALPGVPDMSVEKLARCTAFKRGGRHVQKVHTRYVGGPNSSEIESYSNKNITCGPEQLCFYPPPMENHQGGYAEAVNTELGVEIGAYLPFFHYEAAVGELAQSTSNFDSSAFYFYSPRHCEWDANIQRTANGMGGRTPWPYSGAHFGFVNPHVKRDTYPRSRFVQAPWGPHYCGWGLFPFLGQRFAFIHNKRKMVEFMGRMVNTIYPESLTQIYDLLKDNYIVVYQRPTQGLFKSENDGFQESIDDITTLEAHAAKVGGTLYVMPRLLKAFMDAASAMGYSAGQVSINEVQMSIIAEADIHISVQGGPAYMSMLWGKDRSALLVQRKSPELPNEAHLWFDLISGMHVQNTYTDRDLINRVRDVFYRPHLSPSKQQALDASFYGVDTEPRRRLMVGIREKCVKLDTSSGGGQSRYELCPFRSMAQVVYSSEEVYMLGFWEPEGGADKDGKAFAPDGTWMDGVAPGSDPKFQVPRGQFMGGGKDCEGDVGTPRRSEVYYNCNRTEARTEHALIAAGESSMCVYWVNISLSHTMCFGEDAI